MIFKFEEEPDPLPNKPNKTILVVNTGSQKKEFIFRKYRELGFTIAVINKEKNWASPYVDYWILADDSKHDEALQALDDFLLKNINVKIDGVITFWDDVENDVLLTSKIVDKYKLIGIPVSVTDKLKDKFNLRKFCKENDILAPRYQKIQNNEDLRIINDSFDFPIVLKPTLGSSSAFVIKVEKKENLLDIYNYIKRELSEIDEYVAEGSDILAEEYITGNEVDIDILMQDGEIKFYSISDNNLTNEPYFVETGQNIPSSLPENKQSELFEMARDTLIKAGVKDGCIHFEAKSNEKGAYPIEVNLRMGGDEVHSFVKGAWGVDLAEYAVKIALGEKININKPDKPYKYLFGQYFLPEQSGIVESVEISDEIYKSDYLFDLKFFNKKGDKVLAPPEGYDYMGWLTVLADNYENAKYYLNKLLQLVSYKIKSLN